MSSSNPAGGGAMSMPPAHGPQGPAYGPGGQPPQPTGPIGEGGPGYAYMDSYAGAGMAGNGKRKKGKKGKKAVTAGGPESGGTMLHAQAEGYENAPTGGRAWTAPAKAAAKAAMYNPGSIDTPGPLAAALAQHQAAAAKLMAWAGSRQPPPPAAGHARDSLANAPGAGTGGPVRHPATGQYAPAAGQLAAGHVTARDGGPVLDANDPQHCDVHLNCQPVTPRATVTISTVCGAPPASSYHDHQGTATVAVRDAAAAASPLLAAGIGREAPAHAAGLARPDAHGTAPRDQAYRVNSVRPGGAPSLPSAYYSGRTTPYGTVPRVDPPGAAFSCGAPGAAQ